MLPIDQIKKIARLTPEIEERLMEMMTFARFRKGDIIRGSVNLSASGYYIVQGSARVFVTTQGKELTISFSFDDEYVVPGRNYLKVQPDTISVQFLEDTDVIYIPHNSIKDIMESYGVIQDVPALLFLNAALTRYNEFLEERIYMMQTMTAPQRYAWLTSRYPRLLHVATITQIASYLGVTKETLYRIRNNNY